MKSLKSSKTLQIGLVATALSTLPMLLPVSAQVNPTTPDGTAPTTTTPGGTAPTTTAPDGTAPTTTAPDGTAPTTTAPDGTAPTTTTIDRTDDVYEDHSNWGWLGLLGLIGLAGLKRKPEERAYRPDLDPDPTRTTRTDYRK